MYIIKVLLKLTRFRKLYQISLNRFSIDFINWCLNVTLIVFTVQLIFVLFKTNIYSSQTVDTAICHFEVPTNITSDGSA